MTEDIRAGIDGDKKLLTILLLFDFSKAFDTISPTKLLCKLSKIGFSRTVLLWIKSYIAGRTQRVITRSNGQSDWVSTNLGVPQGSVLGPLLFSLYINDLSVVFNCPQLQNSFKTINHVLYADDLQTYVRTTIDELTAGIARLSDTARAVAAWAQSSGLRLNVGKTKAIIFGSKYNINLVHELQLPGIEVDDGVVVPFADTVKSLGVIMDSKLTWKEHVEHVTKTVNRVLYSLKFFKSSTTEALRKQLAGALDIDYCSIVFLDVNDGFREKLQKSQNSCVRYISAASSGTNTSLHTDFG